MNNKEEKERENQQFYCSFSSLPDSTAFVSS